MELRPPSSHIFFENTWRLIFIVSQLQQVWPDDAITIFNLGNVTVYYTISCEHQEILVAGRRPYPAAAGSEGKGWGKQVKVSFATDG